MLATFLCVCVSFGPFLAEEPATFEFKRKSGPAKGRKEAFDVGTQAYYLHVEDVARFEIKAVTPDAQKRAFVEWHEVKPQPFCPTAVCAEPFAVW